MKVNEIKGNLITLAREGKFDVVVHGVNCQNVQGAGLAPQMVKEFGTDNFELEQSYYKGDYNKLGQIDYQHLQYVLGDDGDTKLSWRSEDWNAEVGILGDIQAEVTVVNAYTQYGFGRNHEGGMEAPIDYIALRLVMQKINHIFAGKHIGLPWIGAGLAGGDWNKIKQIIITELTDCEVTLVEYDGNK